MENVPGEDSMAARSPIVTKYLLTINLQFELESFNALTPYGGRRFVHSGTGSFEGDGLRGTVVPGAFGSTLIRSDGVWEINVRVLLRPDDDEGNGIYASWMGLRHASPEVTARLLREPELVDPHEYYFRITPYFETGSEKYAWLNKICSIGIGEWVSRKERRLRIFQVM
jgi:hypothetical protein